MGSLDKYCRLCALCVRQDHLLKVSVLLFLQGEVCREQKLQKIETLNYQLWDDQAGPEEDQAETANCEKLRFDAKIPHYKESSEVNLNVFRNFLGFGLSKEDRLPKQVLIKPLIALYEDDDVDDHEDVGDDQICARQL